MISNYLYGYITDVSLGSQENKGMKIIMYARECHSENILYLFFDYVLYKWENVQFYIIEIESYNYISDIFRARYFNSNTYKRMVIYSRMMCMDSKSYIEVRNWDRDDDLRTQRGIDWHKKPLSGNSRRIRLHDRLARILFVVRFGFEARSVSRVLFPCNPSMFSQLDDIPREFQARNRCTSSQLADTPSTQQTEEGSVICMDKGSTTMSMRTVNMYFRLCDLYLGFSICSSIIFYSWLFSFWTSWYFAFYLLINWLYTETPITLVIKKSSNEKMRSSFYISALLWCEIKVYFTPSKCLQN